LPSALADGFKKNAGFLGFSPIKREIFELMILKSEAETLAYQSIKILALIK